MQNGSGSGSLTNSGENSLVATISRSMDAQARVGSRASNTTSEDSSSYVSADGFENDDGMGVFGRGGFGGGSSCSSSSASRASKEEAAGDEGTGEARKPKKQRKILFKGKWYTEEQISEMERVARSLTDKIDETLEQKNKATKKGEKKSAPESTSAAAGSAVSKAKDGGFKPKESVDQSPEALSAAIFVVHGGNLTKTSKSKLGGESRNVLVKMSTGGMITWGSKTAHAMRAFVQKDAYDPKMSKAQYRDMDCKFAVVLEGDKFFAHSNDGGTVRAVEGRVLEFIAGSPEDCKKWVLGITAVLDMMKREAASRAAKARVIESAPSDARVKSVFITRPMATAPAGDFAQHRSNSLPSLQSRAHVASSSSAVSERDVAPVAESRHPPSVAVAAARDSESPPLTAVSSSQASNVSTESSGRPDDGRAGRIDVLRFLEEGKERENAGLAASISRGGGVDIGHIVEDEAGSRDAHECQEETNGRAERRKAVEEEMKKEEERKRSAKGKEEREAENRRAVEEKKEEEERKRSAKEKEEREAENRRAVEEKKEEERKRPAKEKEEREAERKKQEEGLGARDGGSKEEGIHAKSDVTAPRQSNVNAVTCDDSGKGDGKIPGLAKALVSALVPHILSWLTQRSRCLLR
jgi:membrane protein involved in colicin uptake